MDHLIHISVAYFPAQVANYIFGNNIAKGSEETSEAIAMTSHVSAEEDFRSMKGGSGEKIAMTSPVATDMDGAKCDPPPS